MGGNDPKILDIVRKNFTEEDKTNKKLVSEEKIEKLLGYQINYEDDDISLGSSSNKIPIEILNGTKVPNKKEVLQFLMSVFDPLGLFCYFTSKIKLIYHWMCKDKYDWKEILHERYTAHWKKIIEWFQQIQKIKVPRCYCPNIDKSYVNQLVIFGDAGKEIACAVSYIRVLNKNREQIGFRLIASKSFVVPLKQRYTYRDTLLHGHKLLLNGTAKYYKHPRCSH